MKLIVSILTIAAIALTLAIVLTVAIVGVSEANDAEQLCGFEVCGDLNNNGSITASDAQAALRVSVGLDTPDYCDFVCTSTPGVVSYDLCGDVDGTGLVTVIDAGILLHTALGFYQEEDLNCPGAAISDVVVD